jgi:hypothetical protein
MATEIFVDVEDLLAGIPVEDRDFVARRIGDGKLTEAEVVEHRRRGIVNTVVIAEALGCKRKAAIGLACELLGAGKRSVERALAALEETPGIVILKAVLRGEPAALNQLDGRAMAGIVLIAMQVRFHKEILADDAQRIVSRQFHPVVGQAPADSKRPSRRQNFR